MGKGLNDVDNDDYDEDDNKDYEGNDTMIVNASLYRCYSMSLFTFFKAYFNWNGAAFQKLN